MTTYEDQVQTMIKKYPFLNVNSIYKIYAKAYEMSHAYGFDEVAMTMDDLVDMVRDVLNFEVGR